MVGVFSVLMAGVVATPDQALYFSSSALIRSSIEGECLGDSSGSETSSNASLLTLVLETLTLKSDRVFESTLSLVETTSLCEAMLSLNFFGTALLGDKPPRGLIIVVLFGDVWEV